MHLEPPVRIGVISDTHGKLDSRALEAFAGVDLIVHAGDVGARGILYELEGVAPVLAVRGNTDHAPWTLGLPDTAVFTVGVLRAMVVHDARGLQVPEGTALVISGHTHRPLVEAHGATLHVNPGSATEPRGQDRVRTVAIVSIEEQAPQARIITL